MGGWSFEVAMVCVIVLISMENYDTHESYIKTRNSCVGILRKIAFHLNN